MEIVIVIIILILIITGVSGFLGIHAENREVEEQTINTGEDASTKKEH